MSRIVKVAMEMFGKWIKGDKSAIHPDLRSAVFAIAIKDGGKEEVSILIFGGIVNGSGKQCINLQPIKLSPPTNETPPFVISDEPLIPN